MSTAENLQRCLVVTTATSSRRNSQLSVALCRSSLWHVCVCVFSLCFFFFLFVCSLSPPCCAQTTKAGLLRGHNQLAQGPTAQHEATSSSHSKSLCSQVVPTWIVETHGHTQAHGHTNSRCVTIFFVFGFSLSFRSGCLDTCSNNGNQLNLKTKNHTHTHTHKSRTTNTVLPFVPFFFLVHVALDLRRGSSSAVRVTASTELGVVGCSKHCPT